MIYGYARVSTQDQDLELQLAALKEAGCEEIYADKISGTANERPELDNLRKILRPGDHVVVWKLDRLFRSTIDALTQIEAWSEVGIVFTCTTQGVTTSDDSPTGKLLRTVLMGFAEFERDLISERTKAGMAAAKANGTHVGRPKKVGKLQLEDAKEKIAHGWPIAKVARLLKVSRATLYRALDADQLLRAK